VNILHVTRHVQSLYSKGGQSFQNRYMRFLLCLKTHSLVTSHPNVLTLSKAGNSDMLFHEVDHFCVTYL